MSNAHWLAVAVIASSIARTDAVAASPPGAQAAVFRLPAQPFAELRRDVARARAGDARSFAIVSDLVTLAPSANAQARARRAPVALYLAKLGPAALMPMLEMLAIDPPRGISAEDAPTVRLDLIEAVGLLRDPRGLPVLGAILDDPTEDEAVARTTSEAIARIGTDDAATKLVHALAAAHNDRARAIVAGMGECRRLPVTEALSERLSRTTDDATARVAARALGRMGNSWAWKTKTDRADELMIREKAARALLNAFVRWTGETRDAAANALLVVDAPQTASMIVEARKKSASAEEAKALDSLARRLAKNPVR
jgi:hypothetical protein